MADSIRIFIRTRLREESDLHDTHQEMEEIASRTEILRLHGRNRLECREEGCTNESCPSCVRCTSCTEEQYPCRTLRFLAYPYRDYPDFLPGWSEDLFQS